MITGVERSNYTRQLKYLCIINQLSFSFMLESILRARWNDDIIFSRVDPLFQNTVASEIVFSYSLLRVRNNSSFILHHTIAPSKGI